MRAGWWKNLYLQVLVAIVAGVLLGHFQPDLGASMKPLGDGFIKLVKMIIAPVIFLTIVVGIAKMGDLRHVGRIGLKALIYFEVLTTAALVIGLVVANTLQPGVGMGIDPAVLDSGAVAQYRKSAEQQGVVPFLLNVIPHDFLSAFTEGQLLQVLLVALLAGIALTRIGQSGERLLGVAEDLSHVFFTIVGMIMRLAPIGAFGAMAFTVGKFGLDSLASLGWLLVAVYLTCALFVFIVLGLVSRLAGFSLWRFLVYIRSELLPIPGHAISGRQFSTKPGTIHNHDHGAHPLPALLERIKSLPEHSIDKNALRSEFVAQQSTVAQQGRSIGSTPQINCQVWIEGLGTLGRP